MASWHFSKPRIPARALAISGGALIVPFAASQWASDASVSPLVWLVALIPAFMLAYYRGWSGVATALAGAMATIALSNVVLLLRGVSVDELLLLTVISLYIAICLGVGWLSEALHTNRARAELMALTDELTALPNRRRIRMFLDDALAVQHMGSVAVVLFDLDNFKLYNDQHGHPSGDDMLCTFADVLSALVPKGGMPARYGGEEFLVVLAGRNEPEAVVFANRVRNALATAQPAGKPITVSAGVVAGGLGAAVTNELIVAADQALYRAKQEGRDRVCCATELVAAGSWGQ
ncbi:MAG TPA: diguanylate cyclase [Longimicrobiales bacterium]|nr:diguanylate cyclase [Longimicrobiales bacterium]